MYVLRRWKMLEDKWGTPKAPQLKFHLGDRLSIGAGGKMWRRLQTFGAKVIAPATKEFVERELGPAETDEAGFMEQGPDLRYKLPQEVLEGWAKTMIGLWDTESALIYGRSRKDGVERWLAVMPKQEVTSSSVDLEEIGDALQYMMSQGYTCVGSLHIHPGSMSCCSGTDKSDLFTDVGGIHYIVPRLGGQIGVYYSASGAVWKLTDTEGWKTTINLAAITRVDAPVRRSLTSPVGKSGARALKGMVKAKTYTTTVWPAQGGYYNGRRTNGYEYDDEWLNWDGRRWANWKEDKGTQETKKVEKKDETAAGKFNEIIDETLATVTNRRGHMLDDALEEMNLLADEVTSSMETLVDSLYMMDSILTVLWSRQVIPFELVQRIGNLRSQILKGMDIPYEIVKTDDAKEAVADYLGYLPKGKKKGKKKRKAEKEAIDDGDGGRFVKGAPKREEIDDLVLAEKDVAYETPGGKMIRVRLSGWNVTTGEIVGVHGGLRIPMTPERIVGIYE
jgi:hypothetical protein